MTVIDVQLIGSGDDRVAWPDLALGGRYVIYVTDAWQIAGLEGGTVTGEPSVALRLDGEVDLEDIIEPGGDIRIEDTTPDGSAGVTNVAVVAETTLRAWIAATCALRGRFPEAFAGTPLAVP
jgi:hypothetical protein